MIEEKSRGLRILLVIDSYPPVLGGSEIEAQRVSSALIRRGHTVQVLCAGGSLMPQVRDWTDPEGVPVRILTRKSTGRRKDMAFAIRVAWEIWKGRKQYDLVYFLMQGLQVATGLPTTRFLRKPAIMKISGSGVIGLMRRSRIGRLELKWLRDWNVPLIVLNEGMIQEALDESFSRDQLIWMPNPVDVENYRPAIPGEVAAWRERHGIPLEAKVLLYVGRLGQEKGLQPLMRGFASVMDRVPDALLVLVGGGPIKRELQALARNLDPKGNRIRFQGWIPTTEVPFWLRSSDVFALTSPNEGFSCALLEAMSTALPSVVSSIPANLQLIDHGIHGLTVTWDQDQAIGESMFNLLTDCGARQRMGNAARRRVLENYSTEKVLQLYEETFGRVVAGGK